MKNTHQWQWAATLCSAVALCGTLAAQTPPQSPPPSYPPPSPSPSNPPSGSPQSSQPTGRAPSDAAGQVTATGCLQRDSSSPSASQSSSPAAGGGFVLKNAKMGGESSSSTSSSPASSADPSGRAPGSMSSSASKDVQLMADSSVNLSEHIGHQVMITGRMSGGSGAPADHQPSPSSSSATKGGSFTVTKVSMISATCTTGS